MTVKFQLSDKRGDAILLASAEHEDPGVAYQNFRVAAEDAGLNSLVESFGRAGVTGAAIAAATAITQPPPAAYAPAQQYAPAPQMPAAAGMTCAHGQRTRRAGTNARGDWVGHFCPSPKGSPDQCKAIFE